MSVMTGRLWLALALVPFANVPLGAAAFYVLVWSGGWSDGLHNPLVNSLLWGVLVAFIAFLITLVGAIPAVFWMRRRGPITLRRTLTAGVLLGNAPLAFGVCWVLILTLTHLAAGTLSEHLSPMADLVIGIFKVTIFGSVLGLASAWLVWMVGIRNTPLAEASGDSHS